MAATALFTVSQPSETRRRRLRRALDRLYAELNQPQFIDPDPLWPVLRFSDPRDQEAAGLVAASLAFGNVRTILTSYQRVMDALRIAPRHWHTLPETQLRDSLQGFRHRYVAEPEMSALLSGIAHLQRTHGSLGAAFDACSRTRDADVLPALGRFVHLLKSPNPDFKNYLLPDPAGKSACKRWMMYLRWMLRQDAVDPGSWRALGVRVPANRLLIPVDTHMLRIARRLGLTQRSQATLATAQELTASYAALRPTDPVRYDFCLTRLGIRSDQSLDDFITRFGLAYDADGVNGSHRT